MSEDGSVILAVNGEIYNHVALRKSLQGKYEFKTHSDCEVIMYLVSHGSLVRRAQRRQNCWLGAPYRGDDGGFESVA